MKTEDIRCPVCGTLNCGLYLDETDGWMECISCGCTVLLKRQESLSRAERRDICWQVDRICPFPSNSPSAGMLA